MDENTITLILIAIAIVVIIVMAIEKARAEHRAKAEIKFTDKDLPLTLTPEKTKLQYDITITTDENTQTTEQQEKHPLKFHVLNTFANGMRNFGGKLKRTFSSKAPINSLFNASSTAVKSVMGLNPIYQMPSNFFILTNVLDKFESYLTVDEKNGKNRIYSLFIL